MALRFVTRRPSARRPLLPAPGTYLTDGQRLFRVVGPVAPPRGVTDAVLENCMSLTLTSYSAADLFAMNLRQVSSEGIAGANRQ
ncbi:MAG: hypothetical protein WBQ18_04110 [Solirubrobacteraceae bacterium]